MHLKGYQVWISCDGRPLPEYKVERKGDDGKTITCYIPSESGKVRYPVAISACCIGHSPTTAPYQTFGIVWRDHVNQSHLRFVTKVDGRAAGGNRCRPGGKGTRWGVRTSTTTRQPFQFAPLQTTGAFLSLPCNIVYGVKTSRQMMRRICILLPRPRP